MRGAWDDLEHQRPAARLTARADGNTLTLRPAPDVPASELVYALSDWRAFLFLLVTDQDTLGRTRIPLGAIEHLMAAYRRHYGLCVDATDDYRLLGYLGKPEYRDAVDADLQAVYHLDLVTEWQARRWRKLLSMIDRLDRTSHFQAAIANDDEIAELMLEQERRSKTEPRSRRRLTEYSASVEELAVLNDRIAELIQVTGARKGVRPRKVTPRPRPETALERVRKRQAVDHHNYTVARAFGRIDAQGRPTGKGGPPPTS